MKISHHGGHHGVTGSCHQLWLESGDSLLVDCGTFQGEDAHYHTKPEIEFPLDGIAGLILTHVHIDHVGRVPYLLAAGFERPIYCSRPTAQMLPLVMEDSLRIGFTRNRHLIEKFLRRIDSLLVPVSYHTWLEIADGVRLRLRPAGHILGSAVVEIEDHDRTAVFSGDLGGRCAPLLKPFTSPPRADFLVMESTYGNRTHEGREDRQHHLETVLRRTLKDKGITIIPAFSLGRTQELLYEMNAIFERIQQQQGQSLMKAVDVIVDSPLATRFTELYESMREFWNDEAQLLLATDDQPLVFENLTTIGGHREHLETLDYLAERRLPAIVIAGSGMCTGGRVVNYLKRFLPEPTTDVVFCGYQASKTPGRYLQEGATTVRLDGRKTIVNAKTHQLSGYSAHADQEDLLRFVEEFEERPKRIRLVHGEYDAKRALQELLKARGYEVD